MGSDTVMGTAERRGASGAGGAQLTGPRDPGATDRGRPGGAAEPLGRERGVPAHEAGRGAREQHYRPLWVEEPARRRRMPDPVRTAAVRAVLLIAVTLIQAMVAFLCTMAGSWLAFPMVISSVVSTIAATWGALDVWVTRQVWNQRNGVVSVPSSTARALRRERRRSRRQERAAERAQERIRRRGRAGQLSHS
ncbi:hypothetical protein [Streptomyces luteogriseus]|uniref:hypothetical protein n=1 Tax=Streptomyces luteogriseus TaxID=68233 RepID=UPI00382D23BB